MRLGSIQTNIVMFLYRCREHGAFIGSTTACSELAGYDLPQVERALEGLIRRGLVERKGIACHLTAVARNWAWWKINHASDREVLRAILLDPDQVG
jgi:hypothetical protein